MRYFLGFALSARAMLLVLSSLSRERCRKDFTVMRFHLIGGWPRQATLLGRALVLLAFGFVLARPAPTLASMDWFSVTLDNDLFIHNDDGYTNGIYLSLFDVGESAQTRPSADFWVFPLLWSLPQDGINNSINAYMLGQTMTTPSDITVPDPPEDEIPYSALLAMTNSYVLVSEHYADRISTTLGVVGPWALGEEAQKLIHRIVGANEPQGWDTQIGNEVVFQFTRGRTWRAWVSETDHFDLLFSGDASLGTIQSALSTGLTLRYGRGLAKSFATTLFNNSRTLNPSSAKGGWFLFAGAQVGYIFNQIFTDGNTFKDSRSIEYDPEFVGASAGLAYAWESISASFAISDLDILKSDSGAKSLDDFTQFGTLTVSFKL